MTSGGMDKNLQGANLGKLFPPTYRTPKIGLAKMIRLIRMDNCVNARFALTLQREQNTFKLRAWILHVAHLREGRTAIVPQIGNC